MHPDDLDRVIDEVERATGDNSRPFSLEYRIVRSDGETRWVLDRGQLVRGTGGRLWLDGALFDITERRATEEALRRREVERARTEELRALRSRIVEAADAARRKIERDLHDGAQQRLVSLALEVRMAKSRVEREPASAPDFLQRVGEELGAASAELRELARGIHPAVLTERGLGPALDALASRAPVPVEIVGVPEDRLPPACETTAYFTVAEALTNVAKYANASHASVSFERVGDDIALEIRDDGVGGAHRRRLRAGGPRRPRGCLRGHVRGRLPAGQGHDGPRCAPAQRRLRGGGGGGGGGGEGGGGREVRGGGEATRVAGRVRRRRG